MRVENARRKTLLCSLVASLFLTQADARETVTITSNGKNMFDLVFLDRYESNGNSGASTGTLSADQKRVIRTAAQLWADILSPGSKNEYAPTINVVADGSGEASKTASFYTTWFKQDPTSSALGDAFIHNTYGGISVSELTNGLYNSWERFLSENPRYRGQYPRTFNGGTMHMGTQVESDITLIDEPSMISKRDVIPVAIHEIGHGLGVSLNILADNVYDKYGNNYRTNKSAVNRNVGKFMDSGVTYRGRKTLEVLGNEYVNRMGGLPLNGDEGEYQIEGSHFELDNSLQSHQMWRNWVFFMEAEMAVLVDLGYDIDLKRFYGHSVYGDNQYLINRNPFYARANNAWLNGTPNTETYGIGLHIYGKNNNITQAANLLADGKASAGVRIDGSGNTFTLNRGVRVTGNGINGMGIYTAFGKEHDITINGDVEATGKNGIAIRADFGENTLGDYEGRGSHFRWEKYSNGKFGSTLYNSKSDPTKGGLLNQGYDNRAPEMDLDGALITNLNINGKVKGSDAAVYIAKNAHVENINIGNGADITGDIKSDWEANLEWLYDMSSDVYNSLYNNWTTTRNKARDIANAGLDYRTTLSAARGVTAKIDGNVTGNKSIDIVNNGNLTITGEIDTLSFTNNGTLNSDKGVVVNNRTNYAFTNTGTLNADLVTTNSTVNYTNSGNMSGKIVASGQNTITTTNLGNIGGMDITANNTANYNVANAVVKLNGVSTANLANQEILLHGNGYALTNNNGNLNILLSDTKINNNTITGRLQNSLRISNNEAVYGDLKGNNGVISVTGAVTANTISDYNTLKLNFARANKDNAVLSISQGNVALGGKNLIIGSTDRDILTQAYNKYKLLQALGGSITGYDTANVQVKGTWLTTDLSGAAAKNKLELTNANRLLQTVGIGGNNPVVPDPVVPDPVVPDPVVPDPTPVDPNPNPNPGCYYHNGVITCGNDPQPQPEPQPDPQPQPEPEPQPEPTKPNVSPMYDYLMTLIYGPDWWKTIGYNSRSREAVAENTANTGNTEDTTGNATNTDGSETVVNLPTPGDRVLPPHMEEQDAMAQTGTSRVAMPKETEIIPAAALGAVAMMNTNTDFIASKAVNSGFSYGDGIGGIAAVHGSNLKHEVGSSIEVTNYGAVLGVSKDFGNLTLTPFVDVGSAKSKTKDMGDTDSQSKYKHIAVGVLGRLGTDSGFYTDASIRVGRNKTDFEGRVGDQAVEFDNSATYYAGHLGLGYMVPLSDTTKMDLYAKYYLSHIGSQNIDLMNLTTGQAETWQVDSITSHVSKVGAAFKFDLSDTLRWTVGAAWQRVYGSRAKAILDYSDIGFVGEAATPSLKGDSAVVDLGLNFRATKNLDIGLEATGMFGDTQGGGVKGSFIFKF
ncbi:MAG: hypothetical protein IJ211_04210 [Campylobacter sp.]|nr:hypothetical protein [Campylobacter sp.]